MALARLATVWLGGCSGCHMSFLDLDEWLIELAGRADLVFSPLADVKEYPENVDVVLVEGAVANDENLAMIRKVRERSKVLVSFGDCAVTGNVTALRNPLGVALEVLRPVYAERGDLNAKVPDEPEIVPILIDKVTPVHAVVPVDVYMPGCPPPADRIKAVVDALLDGRPVELPEEMRRFG
jgi:NAD-reducing hydrogenase small subunit